MMKTNNTIQSFALGPQYIMLTDLIHLLGMSDGRWSGVSHRQPETENREQVLTICDIGITEED